MRTANLAYLSGGWGFYQKGVPVMQFHDRVWGPDVSSWQGEVDWQAVKNDGASFGITKISEGIDYKNPYASRAWDAMGNVGMVRIQYHYARPGRYSASEEAAWFLSTMLPTENVGDCIALDLEYDQRDNPFVNGAYYAKNWLEAVSDKMGFMPLLYCNGGIIGDASQRFANFPELGKNVGLWLASWQEVFPKAPPPWDTVALWQFTNSGRVPGIDGFVDLNIFNGTLEQLKKYGYGGPVADPPSSGGEKPSNLMQRLKDVADGLANVAHELEMLRDEARLIAGEFRG